MKYVKIALMLVFTVLVGAAIWVSISVGAIKSMSDESVPTEETEPSSVELTYVDGSEEESSSEDVAVSRVSYSIEEDGVTYNFMFETPDNYEDIIKGIGECVTEEFDSCDIFYPEFMDGTYLYDVYINGNSYTVFLVE